MLFVTQSMAKDYSAIERLVAFNDLAMSVTDVALQGDGAPEKDLDAIKELHNETPAALKQANGDPELKSALKTYLTDLNAFYDGVEPQASETVSIYKARTGQLETRAKRSEEALKVELQARGAE